MTVKTTDRKDKSYDNIIETMRKAKYAYVTIGIHEEAGRYEDPQNPNNAPRVVEVALWNEFGTKDIPERSFIRSAIDGNIEKLNSWREEALENIVEKGWSVEKALEMIGMRIQILIQNKIKSSVPPPNADSTKAHKRREGVPQRTLIETGLMLRSVTYKVVVP